MKRLVRATFQRPIKLGLSAATLLCASVGVAHAAPAIEGVWSFNGGAVDVQSQPNGTLRGVVTAPTKFAQCSHPAGEDMWTEMRQQSDGSYFGLHRWYFQQTCVPNPTLGPTAWRVLQSPTGARFLRVCFSEPGSNLQPTIAANGTSANVSYGCVDSASIAPLPTVVAEKGGNGGNSGKGEEISFRKVVSLPAGAQCTRKRTLRIKLHNPPYDPLKEVVIHVGHRKPTDVRGVKRLTKPIVLRNLPTSAFRVKVLAITVLNQRLSGSRRYRACTKLRSGGVKLGHKHRGSHK